jgi:hypothetical protein
MAAADGRRCTVTTILGRLSGGKENHGAPLSGRSGWTDRARQRASSVVRAGISTRLSSAQSSPASLKSIPCFALLASLVGSNSNYPQLVLFCRYLYIVHMKRVTASEARRNWFRLLDEVIAGEVIAIVRKGKRIVIRREDTPRAGRLKLPDYSAILCVPDVERADSWQWEWPGPETDIVLREDDLP